MPDLTDSDPTIPEYLASPVSEWQRAETLANQKAADLQEENGRLRQRLDDLDKRVELAIQEAFAQLIAEVRCILGKGEANHD